MKNPDGRYELSFFDEPEDSVIEGRFDTLDDAYDRMDNIGSRWIFYPNAMIFDLWDQEPVEIFYAD